MKTYGNGVRDSLSLSDETSAGSLFTQYTMSSWVKMPAIGQQWTIFFRLSENSA